MSFDYQPSSYVAQSIELDRKQQELNDCFSRDYRKLKYERMSLERYWKRNHFDLEEMKRLHPGLYTPEVDSAF
jgi:hypothetical protein